MKRLTIINIMTLLFSSGNHATAQLVIQYCFAHGGMQFDSSKMKTTQPEATKEKRLNLYIISKEKKWDILRLTVRIRARTRSWFKKKQMYVMIAKDTRDAVRAAEKRMKKTGINKIGDIWFDSHGHYAYGHSSFSVGRDKYSYKNISDSNHTEQLRRLSRYCDAKSEIGIGSCYGGATFIFPETKKLPARSMRGDSLMMGLGRIFSSSNIYGCESWVMAKPGIFNNKFAFAGCPWNKRFRDSAFKPVWERLGQWNRYNYSTGNFEMVNTVALNRDGEIFTRTRNYLSLNKAQRIVSNNLQRLEPGLYKKFNMVIEN